MFYIMVVKKNEQIIFVKKVSLLNIQITENLAQPKNYKNLYFMCLLNYNYNGSQNIFRMFLKKIPVDF